MSYQAGLHGGNVERFYRHVARKSEGCWNWIGAKSKHGYGSFKWLGKTHHAHRVMLALCGRPIPDGMHTDHLCRNRACVRPSHLEIVTRRENEVMRSQNPRMVAYRENRCLRGHSDWLNLSNGTRYCRPCRNERKRLAYAITTALLFVAICVRAQPLPEIPFSQAPFRHNMQVSNACVYSDHLVVCTHQWGAYAVDTYVGSFQMLSAVGKIDPVFQHPKITITGDCWASSTRIAATPNVRKWIVGIGTPPMCAASGAPVPAQEVQVYRTDGPLGFRWIGQIGAPLVNRVSSPLILDGDFAYAPEGLFPATHWTKVDLNSLTKVAEGVVAPPPNVQTSIDGFTYAIQQVTQQTFKAVRSGASPTATPVPTPPPTPTPAPSIYGRYITWAYDHGIIVGCGYGMFCPGDAATAGGLVTRAQLCVYVFNLYRVDHPSEPLPACRPIFSDVPCPQ